LRAALALEPHLKESSINAEVLSLAAGYLVMSLADSGDKQAAQAAQATNRRFSEMAVRDLPPDSFARSFGPEFLGYYGFPGFGVVYGAYAIPLASGDYETLRSLARASAKRLEQIRKATPQQDLDRNRALDVAYRTAATASYGLKDYAAADVEIKRALEIQRTIPKRTLSDERDARDALMLAAMIAARLERYAEAQGIIEPVLKFHRGLYARKDNDDLTQHIQFVHALYVSALAAPGQKTAQLTQAAAIIDGLPPQMRRQISVAYLRGQIAEEQKVRH
jgi:hypothetical protein